MRFLIIDPNAQNRADAQRVLSQMPHVTDVIAVASLADLSQDGLSPNDPLGDLAILRDACVDNDTMTKRDVVVAAVDIPPFAGQDSHLPLGVAVQIICAAKWVPCFLTVNASVDDPRYSWIGAMHTATFRRGMDIGQPFCSLCYLLDIRPTDKNVDDVWQDIYARAKSALGHCL